MGNEAFAWREASAYIWTGAAAASAVALVTNTNGFFVRGWANRQSLDGTYRDHETGQRADITIGGMFTNDATLLKINESATAVHIHLAQSANGVSAGLLLYSGRIDNLALQGAQGGIFQWSLQYHANVWSAYGG